MPENAPIYDLVETLPHGGHPVVSRTTFGKWDDLPGSLREVTGGARRLVLTGVSTDCCVLSTALAAADAGVQVQRGHRRVRRDEPGRPRAGARGDEPLRAADHADPTEDVVRAL